MKAFVRAGRNFGPERLQRRVDRAAEHGEGPDAEAFRDFAALSDELDAMFLADADPSLTEMPANQTPADALPRLPDDRLLLPFLRYVRLALATEFCYLTGLTRMVMSAHLQPFLSVERHPLLGMTALSYPPSLPIGYQLNLRGQPPEMPWPAAGWHRRPGAALLVVRAVAAAVEHVGNNVDCGYWVAEKALQELGNESVRAAVLAELVAADVPDPVGALADLQCSAHKSCCSILMTLNGQRLRTQAAGQGREWEAAFRRHTDAMLSLRPDLPALFAQVAFGWYQVDEPLRAQVVALKGLPVADSSHDCWSGVSLRQVLAGSIALAGEARTPGMLRVGVLRRLLGEWAELEAEYKHWVPKGEKQLYEQAGAVAHRFFDARGQHTAELRRLPNDAVVPCLGGYHRALFLSYAGADMPPTCDGCGQPIREHPKQCKQCRAAWYHGADCQRRHWREGGHKAVCQPLSDGRLDWADELAAAEAGLAASRGGQGSGSAAFSSAGASSGAGSSGAGGGSGAHSEVARQTSEAYARARAQQGSMTQATAGLEGMLGGLAGGGAGLDQETLMRLAASSLGGGGGGQPPEGCTIS